MLAIEAYSEYSQTSKVKLFAEKFDEKSKDVNYFCQKLYLRCLNGFWIYLWTCVGDWRGVKAKKKKILSNEISKINLATRERFWESLMKVTFGGWIFLSPGDSDVPKRFAIKLAYREIPLNSFFFCV